MVKLTLTPYRGNHQRFYPYAGFLGLTSVVVQGTLKTALEEDRKFLKASSMVVRVRCYEAATGKLSVGGKRKAPRVLYEKSETQWQNQTGDEWGSLGDYEAPFRITLPIGAGGASTANFGMLKIWWQVEAVIYHKHSQILGSRTLISHQLPLVRYSPSPLAFSLPAPSWSSSTLVKGLHYSIRATQCVYGPSDPLQITVLLHRDNLHLQVKKISVSLDRQLTLNPNGPVPLPGSGSSSDDDNHDIIAPEDVDLRPLENHHSHTPLNSPPIVPEERVSRTTNVFAVLRERSASASRRSPLPSPSATTTDGSSYFAPRPAFAVTASSATSSPPSPGRALSSTLEAVTFDAVDLPFGRELTFSGCMPERRSLQRYAFGESLHTAMVHVRFVLSVKLHVRSSFGGTEVVELDALPVAVTAVSNEDRELALAKGGRLLAIADAEQRLFNAPPPVAAVVAPATSSLGNRRTSHFALSIDVGSRKSPEDAVPPSPTRSVGSTCRTTKAVRKRSEQWESIELPVRSKAKVVRRSPSPSGPCPAGALRSSAPYVASALGQISPIVQINSPFPEEDVESLSVVNPPLSAHASYFSPPTDVTNRPTNRRHNRSSGPYSRPRSAGGASISSQRSRDGSSCGDSISGLSISSSTSGRFTRERSAPPSSASTLASHDLLLLPLSLYPTTSQPVTPATTSSETSDRYVSGTIPIPSSPCMSDCSDSSESPTPPFRPPSPTIDFNSFSLTAKPTELPIDAMTRAKTAPPIKADVGPFDKGPRSRGGRPLSMSSTLPTLPSSSRQGSPSSGTLAGFKTAETSTAGRRKSSVGFALFGKTAGDDEESTTPKEGGRWGFLRRASKV